MLVLFLASAALAAGNPATPPDAPPAGKPKKEAKICRTIEITGSRMGVREVCMPAPERDYQKRQAEDVLSGRRGLTDGGPVGLSNQPLPQ